jgi:hypothetical protein
MALLATFRTSCLLCNDTTIVAVLGSVICEIVEYEFRKWKMLSPVAWLAWQN